MQFEGEFALQLKVKDLVKNCENSIKLLKLIFSKLIKFFQKGLKLRLNPIKNCIYDNK
jgi:hypothetical protein